MSTQPIRRHREMARRAGWVSLFALCSFVLMAASSPQCARTQDTPLAPTGSLSPSGDVGICLQDCAGAALAARTQERERFRAAMEACQTPECNQQEAALHVSIMQEIASEERACLTDCHNQGGGSGGN
jgi:hypothetical protein